MTDEIDIQRSKDSKGRFFRAGDEGRKFYYETGNADARREAKRFARIDARSHS